MPGRFLTTRELKELPPLPPKSEWGPADNFEKHLASGAPRCQEFSRNKIRSGKRGSEAQCPNPARLGMQYCRFHARKHRPKKAISVKQEFSRYKRYIPASMLARLTEIANDPNVLSMMEEIDLITARLGEVLERIDTRQSELAWRMVQEAYDVVRAGINTNDPDGVRRGMSILHSALSRSDYPTWHEVVHLIQHRRTLVESERRRAVEQAEVIGIMEVMAIIAAIQEVIFKVVTDTRQRIDIAQGFKAIISPDVMLLPDTTQRRVRKDEKGCYVCRHDFFRVRNADENGNYLCPECNTMWSAEENNIIVGEAVDVAAEDQGSTLPEGPGPERKRRRLRRPV